MSRLKDYYNTEVTKTLMKEFKIKNPHAVMRFEKAVVNVGVGEAIINKKAIENVQSQIELITGQKTVVTKARTSIAAYKIRKGQEIGVKVTLRGEMMYYFLDKVINIVIPRLRDFRGIKHTAVDHDGNLNLGFTEQTIFPEIEYDKIDKTRGLEVTIVTHGRDSAQGKRLFELMGVPFVKVI